MKIIEVENLSKTFKRQIRIPGFWGALRGLVRPEYEIIKAVKASVSTIDPLERKRLPYFGIISSRNV